MFARRLVCFAGIVGAAMAETYRNVSHPNTDSIVPRLHNSVRSCIAIHMCIEYAYVLKALDIRSFAESQGVVMATVTVTRPTEISATRPSRVATTDAPTRRFDGLTAAVIVGGTAFALGSYAWLAWAVRSIHISI